MKPKFEVGDIIRAIDNTSIKATITYKSDTDYKIRYTVDSSIRSGEEHSIYFGGVDPEAELATIADTAITRKLYPNAKITKKGLMV
jgi:hypothetical protein